MFLAHADPVHELPTSWGTKLRTGGLAVILMRAGLKIDKLAFARAGKVVLRLAAFPMLFEALVDAGGYYWSACSPTLYSTPLMRLLLLVIYTFEWHLLHTSLCVRSRHRTMCFA